MALTDLNYVALRAVTINGSDARQGDTVSGSDMDVAQIRRLLGSGAIDVAPVNLDVAQAAKIADPSGGGVIDAEARTAINAIIDVLEANGLSATA